MRNYNVGDKFVVEIEEVFTGDICNLTPMLYRIKGFNSLVFDKNGLDKLERLDGDYVNENFGELQDEAYEADRKAGQEEAIKWSQQNETDMYNAGLNDAWKLAKQILYGIDKQLIEIFDVKVEPAFFDLTHKREIINSHTPQEARAMIDEWKESKEIKVGDVVESGNTKGVALKVYNWEGYTKANVLMQNGVVQMADYAHDWQKTGKHIDISDILAEIGKE